MWKKSNETLSITTVIAPKTESSWGRVSTSNRSNFEFVKALSQKKLQQIVQVHSHPTNWVDHSDGDDEWASYKFPGLISIVVPNYCKKGISHSLNVAYIGLSTENSLDYQIPMLKITSKLIMASKGNW